MKIRVAIFMLVFVVGIFAFANVIVAEENKSSGNTTMNDTNLTIPGNETNVTIPGNETNMTSPVDDVTKNETTLMYNIWGAKMRLLQLEKHIRIKMLRADAVISVLGNRSGNITELQKIREELAVLADEVHQSAIILSVGDVKNETVQYFVNSKKEANDLLKKFRDASRDLITPDDKRAIQEKFKELKEDSLNSIKQGIEEQRRLFNSQRVGFVLSKFGLNDTALLEQIKNGSITRAEALRALRENMKNLSEDAKGGARDAWRNMLEERKELREQRIENIEKMENRVEQKALRLEQRLSRTQLALGKIRQRSSSQSNTVSGGGY